jgi:Mg-chelatase subunit ChlD
VFTDETSSVRDLRDLLLEEPDPRVRRTAREIASRLALRHRGRDRIAARGPGRPASAPYRGGADDIDLDRTIEVLAERPLPEDEDLIVRTSVTARRAVALVVDISGSMKGEKAHVVAAAVGAVAGELQREELTVLAFWQDSAVLATAAQPVDPLTLLDDLLRLPAQGLTNIHGALEVAAAELARSRLRERVAILLSDCVHNAGPDPRLAVRRLPRLHVLLQTEGEHDAWLARELARLGGGGLAAVAAAADVAPALNRLLRP